MTEITKLNIVPVIEPYAELKKKGRYLWALCPLPGHIEKTPSFKVDPERQTFHCFGCGAGGNVISFVMKYHGMGFKEALAYLSIEGDRYRPSSREMRRRDLVRRFNEWVNDFYDERCVLLRTLHRAKLNKKTEEEVCCIAEFYHLESAWRHQIAVLLGNDDMAKVQMYREIHGF